jgi:hypothetical protein
MPWWEYEARVLDFLGVPRASRQVEFSTPWGSRIFDGVRETGAVYEVTKLGFGSKFDDLASFERLQGKLAQLEKDAFLLENGRIRSLTVVTPDVLPVTGRGAEFTRRLMQLQQQFGTLRREFAGYAQERCSNVLTPLW